MTRSIAWHDLAQLSAAQRTELLTRSEADLGPFLEKVAPIIEAVRNEGDEAIARFSRDFDKAPVDANSLAATPEDFDEAFRALDPAQQAADVIAGLSAVQ